MLYLSEYLYRGVISENDILCDMEGTVYFTYKQSKTNATLTKEQPAVDFLWTLLKHVLPQRFRRVRDYGFLHGSAKKQLKNIQDQLKTVIKENTEETPRFCCRLCKAPKQVVHIVRERIPIFLCRARTLKPGT